MEASEKDSLTPPELVPLPTAWNGDAWNKCEDDLYQIFLDTLVKTAPLFRGVRVSVRRMPTYKGKHAAFWHLISEGEKEEERTPDFRRCERLGWIGWVIANCDATAEICWFENKRASEKCVVLWYEPQDYAVILAKRKGYLLLKTAYLLEPHQKKTFQRERDEFRRRKPQNG
jgi:hypothetical protein